MATKMLSINHLEYLKAGYNPTAVTFPGTIAQLMGGDVVKAGTVFNHAKQFADLIRIIESNLPSHVAVLAENINNPYSMAFIASDYSQVESQVFSKGSSGGGGSITLMERNFVFSPVDFPEKQFYFCISVRLVDVFTGTSSGASCKMFVQAGCQYGENQGGINEIFLEREWGNCRIKSGGVSAIMNYPGAYRTIFRDNSICFVSPDGPVQGDGGALKSVCYLNVSETTNVATRHNGMFSSPIYIGVGEYSSGPVVQDVVVGVHGDIGRHEVYSSGAQGIPGPYLTNPPFVKATISSYGLVDGALLAPKLSKEESITPILVNGRPVLMPITNILPDSGVIEIPDLCFYYEASPNMVRTGVLQLVAGDEVIVGYRNINSLCLSDSGNRGVRGCASLFMIMDEDYDSQTFTIT